MSQEAPTSFPHCYTISTSGCAPAFSTAAQTTYCSKPAAKGKSPLHRTGPKSGPKLLSNAEEGTINVVISLMALELADRVYVMDKGEIVYEGKPEELWANRKLSQELLGV